MTTDKPDWKADKREGSRRAVMIGCLGGMFSLVVATLLLASTQAYASFGAPGLRGFTTGAASTDAGAHPDVFTTISINRADAPGFPGLGAGGQLLTLKVDLPPGLMGNPNAVKKKCPRTAPAIDATTALAECPPEAQVGVVHIATEGSPERTDDDDFLGGVYVMESSSNEPASLLILQPSVPLIRLSVDVRTDTDFGIATIAPDVHPARKVRDISLKLWGVPGAHTRGGIKTQTCFITCTTTIWQHEIDPDPPSEWRPFMTNPTVCDSVKRTVLETTFAEDPYLAGVTPLTKVPHQRESFDPMPTNCQNVPFDPDLELQPTVKRADDSTGLEVNLALPQNDDPNGIGTSHLRRAVVTLPEGVSVNPAAGDGLTACTDEEYGHGNREAARCPDASQIGTVKFDVPLLTGPINGVIYLGEPLSTDPQSDKMFRIWQYAEGFGMKIKIPGYTTADPVTGRLRAVFENLPQVPFSNFKLTFKGGPRGMLATPQGCGTHTTVSELEGWSGKTVTSTSSFDVSWDGQDAGCPDVGFAPSFSSGTVVSTGRAFSPFTMVFGRNDREQTLGAIHASLPAGLIGMLKSVALCSVERTNAGTCGQESRVGSVLADAGAGDAPLQVPGEVYLTHPLRPGDIAGMLVKVRAKAGPYDLGWVNVRAFLKVRARDQGIDVASEPMPQIWHGIPLRVRRVAVTIDREQFMFNPTSCVQKAIYGTIFSGSWTRSSVQSPFQATGCAALPASPNITVQAGGAAKTNRYRSPALKVTIRQLGRQAALDQANVVLPRALNVDLKAPPLQAACPREVYAQDKCPAAATIGRVTAITPVLADPLTGPVFLLRKRGDLPDVVMRLSNKQHSLDLIGVMDFLKDGRIITRVKNIPDVPIDSFQLVVGGGKGGPLLNRSDLCAKKDVTQGTFRAQNGKVVLRTPVTRIHGCKTVTQRTRSTAATKTAAAKAKAAQAQAVGKQ